MPYVILGALGLAVAYVLFRGLINLDPRTLAAAVRYLVAALLIGAGSLLVLRQQFALGAAAIALGGAALLRGRIGSFDLGGGRRSPGRSSTVRARFVETTLDHDSGTITGTVKEGAFAGRGLDELTDAELRTLHEDVAGDGDSVALLEAYLDRRFPGWREDGEENAGPRTGGSADAGAMTDKEAYEILGLTPGAGEAEIRAAHRRLLKGVHPDQGGSTVLAARVNQAKDKLLGRHH